MIYRADKVCGGAVQMEAQERILFNQQEIFVNPEGLFYPPHILLPKCRVDTLRAYADGVAGDEGQEDDHGDGTHSLKTWDMVCMLALIFKLKGLLKLLLLGRYMISPLPYLPDLITTHTTHR